MLNNEYPCKTCLKYIICNGILRNELSQYRNITLSIILDVVVIFLVFKCKDFSNYVDEEIEKEKHTNPQIKNFLDNKVSSIAKKIFNLKDIKYNNDITI